MHLNKSNEAPVDVIWGIGAIAEAIGQSFAATAYMLKQGHIPAKKVGDRWVASRKKLESFFAGDAV